MTTRAGSISRRASTLLIKALCSRCVASASWPTSSTTSTATWHFQEWFGFDAIYGFVACVGLVLAAKGLRVLLMRDEDYYGDLRTPTPGRGAVDG